MNVLKRFLKIYREKNGWIKVKTPKTEYLNSRIYFDYKELSDLYDYASNKNFKKELDEASHGLSSVIMYRNTYQLEINERGEEDVVLIAKMFVVCRFANSIYATLRLACMGMILDSVSCLKTAFEALQYARLISLDPKFASNFMDVEKSLRPVEVRRHLERMGHDVELARKKYAMLSTFSHIGGTGETLILEDIGGNIAFKIGGYLDPGLQRSIIQDCHKACGEFIAFSIGIRHENVETYHRTIKEWIAEGLSSEEMLRRIKKLMVELR
jgi:hypothetical protein